MLEVSECLDVAVVETLRSRILHHGLDETDNYAYHLILAENGDPIGCVRLYESDSAPDTLVVDRIALPDAYGIAYRDLLLRSMLLRAIGLNHKYVEVHDPVCDLYSQMGFTADGKIYRAACDQIRFTCKCHTEKEERS